MKTNLDIILEMFKKEQAIENKVTVVDFRKRGAMNPAYSVVASVISQLHQGCQRTLSTRTGVKMWKHAYSSISDNLLH